MSAIFISHSSKDAAAAKEVVGWLTQAGHRAVFLAFDPEHGIPAGCRWELELYQQMRRCRAVIVICSKSSVASKWCFAEVVQARSLGKALLPVRIDDCNVDSTISDRQIIQMYPDPGEARRQLSSGLVAAGLDPTKQFDWDDTRPPFPGLLPFEEADAAIFFGRDDQIVAGLDLLNRVRRLRHASLVLVLGPSGSGKSSLVRAGVVPRLRRDRQRWVVVDPFRPGHDPVRALAVALRRTLSRDGHEPSLPNVRLAIEASMDDPTQPNPVLGLADQLGVESHEGAPTILFTIDQFEELLGYPDDHPATRVTRYLRATTATEACQVVLMATMRSDFLGVFAASRDLRGLPYESLPLASPSADDIAETIERPAHFAGIELGPGLVRAMVDDTERGDALPLLAFALRELYERFGTDRCLELSDYRDELGGLDGAITRVADEVLRVSRLSPEQENHLRLAFMAMVRLTDDNRRVRRVARWDETPADIHPVVERFVAERLLVSGGDPTSRTIEVAHEALLRSWGRLSTWLCEHEEALRLRRDIEHDAKTWEDGGRNSADLWRGPRLSRSLELATTGELRLGTRAEEFIRASRRAEAAHLEEEERRRRRRIRSAVVIVAASLVFALISAFLFVTANRESQRARDESARAQEQSELAAVRTRDVLALAAATQSRFAVDENPALGLALAAESAAISGGQSAEVTDLLVRGRVAFSERTGHQVGAEWLGHEGQATAVAVDDDMTVAASGGGDGTVRLWDPATGQEVASMEVHEGNVFSVALSGDGRLLASAGEDATVRLWDRGAGLEQGVTALEDHTGMVFGVAFSPDGEVLASAGADGKVRLWNTTTHSLILEPLEGHAGAVFGVAFSPDGRWLASAGEDGTVRLWDRADDWTATSLPGHHSAVNAVAFSADSKYLASASNDETVLLWDPSSGAPLGEPMEGHVGAVYGVAFGAAGTTVASAGNDGTVRLWDSSTGSQRGAALNGHSGIVRGVAASARRPFVLSAGDDGALLLWDLTERGRFSERLDAHEGDTWAVAFSPDGRWLASSGTDGVRVWDRSSDDRAGRALNADQGIVFALSFRRDGRSLATAGADGSIVIWDPATGEKLLALAQAHAGEVFAAAFSPDGRLLASGGRDGRIRLWDASTGQLLRSADRGVRGQVYALAFSPDGGRLASAGESGEVWIWDPATFEPVGEPIAAHRKDVFALAFNSRGDVLASGSTDNSVRLWNPSTGERRGPPLVGHGGFVYAVSFSPDAELMVSAARDGTLRLWSSGGQTVGLPLRSDSLDVYGVAFSPDGTQMASGAQGGTVWLWEAIWNVDTACALAAEYVTARQVREVVPDRDRLACDLREG